VFVSLGNRVQPSKFLSNLASLQKWHAIISFVYRLRIWMNFISVTGSSTPLMSMLYRFEIRNTNLEGLGQSFSDNPAYFCQSRTPNFKLSEQQSFISKIIPIKIKHGEQNQNVSPVTRMWSFTIFSNFTHASLDGLSVFLLSAWVSYHLLWLVSSWPLQPLICYFPSTHIHAIWISQSINQSIKQSIYQSINQSIDQSVS